jgi:hypothetical protein
LFYVFNRTVKSPEEIQKEIQEEEALLASMRERERRSYLRAKERGTLDEEKIDELTSKSHKEGDEDDDFGDDFDDDDATGSKAKASKDEPTAKFQRLQLKGAPKATTNKVAEPVAEAKKAVANKKEVVENYYDDEDVDDDEDEDEEDEDEDEEDEEDDDEDEEDDDEEEEEEEEAPKPEPPRLIKIAKRKQ